MDSRKFRKLIDYEGIWLGMHLQNVILPQKVSRWAKRYDLGGDGVVGCPEDLTDLQVNHSGQATVLFAQFNEIVARSFYYKR